MTGISLFLASLGVVAAVAGLSIFANALVAVRRRTRSANLEYGYPPAVLVAVGLGLLDWSVGWPGWPVPAYLLVAIALTVVFAIIIVAVARR